MTSSQDHHAEQPVAPIDGQGSFFHPPPPPNETCTSFTDTLLSMGRLESQLSSVLASREARSIRRRLAPAQAADITNTSSLVDFSSNDYLSLSSSPILRTRFLHSLNTSSQDKLLGAKGSRLLISGGAHAELEDRLAQFFHAPAALLFNSGFDANVSLLASVPQQGDLIIADELVHASMHDGARQSRAIWDQKTHTFQHGSVTSLRRLCNSMVKKYLGLEEGRRSVFVAVESLYSMDGTIAPLPEMVDALEELFPCGNAYLIVDEAHATGIYGPQGRGLVAHFGLENRVFARLHTFGKALAGSGGM
jgi:8-amino-7-oxononanoate synthase